MKTVGKVAWVSDKVPNDKGMALETVTFFNCNIYSAPLHEAQREELHGLHLETL
jgi:hypothetical protein